MIQKITIKHIGSHLLQQSSYFIYIYIYINCILLNVTVQKNLKAIIKPGAITSTTI